MKDATEPKPSGRRAEIFDFREVLRRSKRQRRLSVLKYIAGGVLGGIALGAVFLTWPTISSALADTSRPKTFRVCSFQRQTCVVDGDTFWLEGVKIRIADIDTPELKGRCEWEIEKAEEARDRLAVLLSEGPFDLLSIGARDEDRYGRKLRVVSRNGASLGDQLVREGLARTWTGRREPWC